MTLLDYLALAVIVLTLYRKLNIMSANTDALTLAVAALSAKVPVVLAELADAKAKATTPADLAAIDKATSDVNAAVTALSAAP